MTENILYNNKRLTRNINYMLDKKDMTRKQLQEEIGAGKVYLTRLLKEDSTQEPSIHVIKKISDVLGVSMDLLVYGDVENFEELLDKKQRMFLQKVTDDTRDNKLQWKDFSLVADYELSEEYDLYDLADIDERVYIFRSKYGRKYTNTVNNRSSAYIASLGENIEILLVNLINDHTPENNAYELYVIKDSKSMKCCTNENIGDEIYEKLQTLYKFVKLDPDMIVLDSIYDEYLDLGNIEHTR